MKKILVLAEKKTLAEKIAKGIALGGGKVSSKKDHYEVTGILNGEEVKADVYYLFGHALKIDIEGSFGEGFPKFPEYFKRVPVRPSLWKAIKEALNRAKKGEYDFVVEAGDPDREGELLVREVLESVKFPFSKVKRAWWNSETPKALKEAFENLKDAKEFDSLYLAGKLRQLGDAWTGINLSRKLHSLTGNRNLSVGRVQTPVLALIVKRDREIENFKPEKFYELYAKCSALGKNFTMKFKERIKEETRAKAVREVSLENRPFVVVKVEKKRKKQRPPKLPKLSDVQYYVGKKLKMSAEQVLSVVQGLYERGILSYPRTDSNFLADKDRVLVEKALTFLGKPELKKALNDKDVQKFIFNTKDVEKKGHHAIIPLEPLPEDATKAERIVYDFIAKRLLANLMGYFVYDETVIEATPQGKEKLIYRVVGKKPVVLGWKEVYSSIEAEEKSQANSGNKTQEDDTDQMLPSLKEGDRIDVENVLIKEGVTQPPPRYTSATLIKAMEKLGLGTQATRHRFEEVLVKRGYVEKTKDGKLISTEEGRKFIDSLSNTSITDVELTAEWEKFLKQVEFKDVSPEEGEEKFKQGIKDLVLSIMGEMDKNDYSYLKKRPSPKMVRYALSLAERVGENVDEERLKTDTEYCKSVIESLKGKAGNPSQPLQPLPPTDKQVAFAKKIAQEKGVEIPPEALTDRAMLSKWIDSQLSKTTKGKSFTKRTKFSKRKRYSKKG